MRKRLPLRARGRLARNSTAKTWKWADPYRAAYHARQSPGPGPCLPWWDAGGRDLLVPATELTAEQVECGLHELAYAGRAIGAAR